MIAAAVRRPIAVSMAYATVALLGVGAWMELPVELLPDVSSPRLDVTGSWAGVSPETVEAYLTAPIEAVAQQARDVERVESVSQEGAARVSVTFARGADMRYARLDLGERLAALAPALPAGASAPLLEPYVPRELGVQTRGFMRFALTGGAAAEALQVYADSVLAPTLREVPGVADVAMGGGSRRVVQVQLDEARAAALAVRPESVRRALRAFAAPADVGGVVAAGRARPVTLDAGLGAIADLADVAVPADRGGSVRLGDVATIRETRQSDGMQLRIGGSPAITLEVSRRPRTDAVKVARAVRQRVAEMPRSDGVLLLLEDDQSDAIRAQLRALRLRVGLGAAILGLVLLLTLRSLRAAAIVVATIALSLLATVHLIHGAGLSLNLITMTGLALGLGMIDDNAIVVLESVHRRARSGMAPAEAALEGVRDVLLPVVAATATTVIVLAPFVGLQGELRAYYVPFGLVVGCAVLASLVVSFTFVPALAAAMPARARVRGTAERATPSRFARVPTWCVRHARGVVALAALLLAVSLWQFQRHVPFGIGFDDWWSDDSWIAVRIELPRGSELADADDYARRFERTLATLPVARFNARVVAERAEIRVDFADSLARSSTPLVVRERLLALAHSMGGADIHVDGFGPSFAAAGAAPPFAVDVLGYDYGRVRAIAQELGTRLERGAHAYDIDMNATGRWFSEDAGTEMVLRIDPARLGSRRSSAREVADHVAHTGRSAVEASIDVGGEQVPVTVRSSAADADALRRSRMSASGGAELRIDAVSTLEERPVMSRITRADQQYRRTVTWQYRGAQKQGERARDAIVASMELPAGFELRVENAAPWAAEDRRQTVAVTLAALLLVYMTTAALLESLRLPLVVLLTVPLALIGVFLTFRISGATFTRESWIGVVMLIGMVASSAILLVDRFARLVAAGLDAPSAAARATYERARPILMTTATTVLGVLPLVLLGGAADRGMWSGLGYALLGGLVSGALLVLTVAPALLALIGAAPTRSARCARRAPAPDP